MTLPHASERSYRLTLFLAFFFGVLGAHRFYVGKYISGVIMLLTLGFAGIWAFIDVILILFDGFSDKRGRLILAPVAAANTTEDETED